MLMTYVFVCAFILWLVVPSIKDLMGYNQRDDLNVYEAYVKLLQVRNAKNKKTNY
jgi:hypothetical protein